MKEKLVSFFTLFGSTGTLICCVLPAVVATIAGGAAVSSLISVFPWIIPLSQHKIWIFLVAGILIVLNGILVFSPSKKKQACPADGNGCEVTGRFRKRMFWASAIIYGIGFAFSYLLVPILRILE
jgi:mercuric ion transport protein